MDRRGILVNLALALGVSVLFLIALEGAARLAEKQRPPRVPVADYIWDWDDKMPGGFYVMKFDSVGWPPWEEYNADGLRDRTRPREKPEGTTRVAFLGDSVTLGDQLTPREAFPQLLEARYASEGRRAEVMNVALWGWSTRQQRIAWRRIARHYRPDQAVLAVCLNDIPELYNNLARPPRWLTRLHARSALLRLAVNAEGREIDSVERLFSEPDAPRVREATARFFDEVRALRSEVEADGAAFALVLFPFRFQVEPGAPSPVVQQQLKAFCDAEKLPCLDLLPAIARAGPAAFLDYDHLSASGAQLVADTLRTSGLLTEAASDPLVLREALAARGSRQARAAVAWLDARRTPPEATVLAEIASLLDDGSPSRRQAAAWALGIAGRGAEPFAGALGRRAREDAAAGVRVAAVRALGALGSQGSRAGVAALFAALGDESEAVRAAAAEALVRTGPRADDVPALTQAVASADRHVAGFAAWSLGNLGPAAAPAAAALAGALARPETNEVVSRALARIGPAASAAVPGLVRTLASGGEEQRWRAARTLGRIGPQAAPAVGALTAALGDPSGAVRMHAARALGRIGPAALPSAAALQRTRGDRDGGVADAAREALERLSGKPD